MSHTQRANIQTAVIVAVLGILSIPFYAVATKPKTERTTLQQVASAAPRKGILRVAFEDVREDYLDLIQLIRHSGK